MAVNSRHAILRSRLDDPSAKDCGDEARHHDQTAIRVRCKLRDRSLWADDRSVEPRPRRGGGNELKPIRSSGRINVRKKLLASAGWHIQKAHAFNPRYELFEHRNPFFR